MQTITIEIEDHYYKILERLAENCEKTVEGYTKQTIENHVCVFKTIGSSCYDSEL